MFCRSLFVLLSFSLWPLCCLFFFDLRILITPWVSSESSYEQNIDNKRHQCRERPCTSHKDNLHIFLISHFIRNGCLIPLETNISYPIHPLRVAIKTSTHRSIHVQQFYLHDLVLENLFSACILLNYLLNSG
jgi:hypothetical protein